jgi:hypothetical protein
MAARGASAGIFCLSRKSTSDHHERGTPGLGDEDPTATGCRRGARARCERVEPVTLTVNVTDDGLPKARSVPRDWRPQRGPARSNVAENGIGGPRPRALTVTWFQYGGPAKVTFEPTGALAVTNGTAAVSARFRAPGTYTLIATASDGQLSQRAVVTVPVTTR